MKEISKSEAINYLLVGNPIYVDGREIRYVKSLYPMIQCVSKNKNHEWINTPFNLSTLLSSNKCEIYYKV